jgi:hypothetical protein
MDCFAWGARGPEFKSRRSDQFFEVPVRLVSTSVGNHTESICDAFDSAGRKAEHAIMWFW